MGAGLREGKGLPGYGAAEKRPGPGKVVFRVRTENEKRYEEKLMIREEETK